MENGTTGPRLILGHPNDSMVRLETPIGDLEPSLIDTRVPLEVFGPVIDDSAPEGHVTGQSMVVPYSEVLVYDRFGDRQ